jgi:hypothetical protein
VLRKSERDQVLDVLRTVRDDYLSKPSRWTHGVSARDSRGGSVEPSSERACRWCASGAVYKVSNEKNLPYPLQTRIGDLLVSRSRSLFFSAGIGGGYVTVNDSKGRKAVIQVFSAVISELEEEKVIA